jgi:hypothetical protein
MKIPNVFLGLLRIAAWLFWRPPMATSTKTKREPRPPRRPTLSVTQCSIPDEIHSIIRTSWFKNGRMVEVDEVQVPECDDARDAFQYVVGGALKRGCDVCVMTTYPPEALGIQR